MNEPLSFGVFITPFHPLGQSRRWHWNTTWSAPSHWTGSGFDEAWFGEHHSGGYEMIACPEVFIAAAAERTKNIRFGTGVVSLPYHHPLMVADRWVLLDHLTRGRVMFGTGPGALPSDAYMMGIDPVDQRRMMEESLEAILALFRAEPGERVDRQTDWFTLRDAALHIRPYTWPLSRDIHRSNGFAVRAAAGRPVRHVAAVAVDVGARRVRGAGDHLGHRQRPGPQVRPRPTRPPQLAGAGHRASGRHPGAGHRGLHVRAAGLRELLRRGAGFVPLSNTVEGESRSAREFVAEYAAGGNCCIGTPDDAIAYISGLLEQSGGFGTLLLLGHDWAEPGGHLSLL